MPKKKKRGRCARLWCVKPLLEHGLACKCYVVTQIEKSVAEVQVAVRGAESKRPR